MFNDYKEKQKQNQMNELRDAKARLDNAQKVFWESLVNARKEGITYEEIADLTGFSRANVIYHLNKIKENNPFFIGKATASRGKNK